MVTTTNENDDLPTHDVHGTDLARVRAMLDRGFSPQLIAGCLAISVDKAHYAIVVATGDRQGSPSPEAIWTEAVAEIQSGWTAEQAEAALRREPRASSSICLGDAEARKKATREKVARYWRERQRRRVYEEPIAVSYMARLASPLKWRCHMVLGDAEGNRYFETKEEAQAWGRAWLIREYEKQQAGACCGR